MALPCLCGQPCLQEHYHAWAAMLVPPDSSCTVARGLPVFLFYPLAALWSRKGWQEDIGSWCAACSAGYSIPACRAHHQAQHLLPL